MNKLQCTCRTYFTNEAQTMICAIPYEVSITAVLCCGTLPENVREIKSVRKFKEQINHLFESSDSHSAVL